MHCTNKKYSISIIFLKNHSNQSRFSLRLDSQQIKNAPHTTKVQGADLEEDPGCTEKQCNQEKKNGDMMRFIPY